MKCNNCKTLLSIQDIENSEWKEDSEEFILKCPICNTEKIIVSRLFESNHISNQYLQLIVMDTEKQKKEKYLNYVPENQRQLLISHLKNCETCSSTLESLRLNKAYKDFETSENTYKFFISKAKDVIKELKKEEYKSNKKTKDIVFVFDDEKYLLTCENIFYEKDDNIGCIKIKRKCYVLEKEEHDIGMVSFVITSEKIILEKIWLKSEFRIAKEKQFLSNIKTGKIRLLLNLIQKL